MSRTAWIGLLLLGGGLGLLSYLMFGGLSDEARDRANRLITVSSVLLDRTAAVQKKANDLVGKYDGLKALPTVNGDLAVIDTQNRDLRPIEGLRDTLKKLVSDNKATDESEVFDKAYALESQIVLLPWAGFGSGLIPLVKEATSMRMSPAEMAGERIAKSAAWFDDFDTNYKRAEKTFGETLSDADLVGLKAQRDTFLAKYPESKTLRVRLDDRIDRMSTLKALLAVTQANLVKAASVKPPNSSLAATADSERITALKTLTDAKTEWATSTAQLPIDIDKILVDMQIERGRHQHKLKIIKNGTASQTTWLPVTKAVYDLHRQHLGMTIYSKPEGYMPEDAITVAAPPGYQYIGNPRYGQWRQRNGTSFWEFYGRYALMRDLFWGVGGYRPIYRSEYRGYRSSMSRRRPYFGARKQYGTAKAVKSKRYSKSKYAAKQRKKSSFSGSKYSGSRRSGGYRNSRYRSSSFGGGGK